MLSLLAIECIQAAPQSLCLNEAASVNMLSMLVTLDTSHFEILPLNEVAPQNMLLISSTFDTLHFERSALNIIAP